MQRSYLLFFKIIASRHLLINLECWNKVLHRLLHAISPVTWVFVTPFTIAHQAPPFLEVSRQECRSGWSFDSPGGSPWPRNWTRVSFIAGGFFTDWALREASTGCGTHKIHKCVHTSCTILASKIEVLSKKKTFTHTHINELQHFSDATDIE